MAVADGTSPAHGSGSVPHDKPSHAELSSGPGISAWHFVPNQDRTLLGVIAFLQGGAVMVRKPDHKKRNSRSRPDLAARLFSPQRPTFRGTAGRDAGRPSQPMQRLGETSARREPGQYPLD